MKRGMLFVGISSVLYGLVPLVTKALYATGMNVISACFWRFALIVPVLAAWCLLRGCHLKMPLRSAAELFARIGLFSGFTMYLLNRAYSLMDVGLATTIHYLYPAVVVIIAVAVFRERAGMTIVRSVLLIVAGMAFVSLRPDAGINAFGLACALASAVTYAVYIVQLEKSGFNRIDPFVLTLYTALCNSIFMFVMSGPLGGIQVMNNARGWMATSALALLCFGALVLLAYGSRFLNAGMTSIFGLFEPITSMVVGLLFLGETLSFGQLVGCGLIMLSIFLVAIGENAKNGRSAERSEQKRAGGYADCHNVR